MKAEKLKVILAIVVSLIVIFGVVLAVVNYFAKQSDLSLVGERLDISIVDDQIFQMEQDILRMKIEMRKEPMTDQEKELLTVQRQRLDELKGRREDKLKDYEKRR
jgi:hypothetical protein